MPAIFTADHTRCGGPYYSGRLDNMTHGGHHHIDGLAIETALIETGLAHTLVVGMRIRKGNSALASGFHRAGALLSYGSYSVIVGTPSAGATCIGTVTRETIHTTRHQQQLCSYRFLSVFNFHSLLPRYDAFMVISHHVKDL